MNQLIENKSENCDASWLKTIPESWEARRLKTVCTLNPTKSDKVKNDLDVVFLPMEKVGEDGSLVQDTLVKTEKLKKGFTYFEKNDVIFAKITPCFENGKGALLNTLLSEYGFGSTEFHVLRPIVNLVHGEYLNFLINSDAFKKIGETFMEGSAGQKRVTTDFVKNYLIPLPPRSVQKSITIYLNKKNERIDRFIINKKELIELLREQKEAIIHQAVTRGLDEDVKMKDSGIPWIGEIPEDWEVRRLKYITNKIIDGAHFTPTYKEKGVPFLRVTDIQSKEIDLEEVRYIPLEEHLDLIQRCRPEKGDLLLSKNGTIGLTKVIDWDFDFSIFVSLCLIKPSKKLDVFFAKHFFSSDVIAEQISNRSKQTSVINLHLEEIREFIFILPPLSVQKTIVKYIEQESRKIDRAIAKIEKEISLVEEYKTSLIYHAVTGKITI